MRVFAQTAKICTSYGTRFTLNVKQQEQQSMNQKSNYKYIKLFTYIAVKNLKTHTLKAQTKSTTIHMRK